jgi:hypothetical protein
MSARIITAIAILLSLRGQSVAQTRTDLVCWAQAKSQCPSPYNGEDVQHYPCGSGGNSGFNPNYVCQQVCGAPVGPRCRITAGPGGGGGQCGYRAARIDCFKMD